MLAELDDLTLTPEGLQKIARDETARMLAVVERSVSSAKLFGAAYDPSQVADDIEAGWAARLLSVFGAAGSFAFDETCPARAFLTRSGVDATYFPGIRNQFNTYRVAWLDNGPLSETGRILDEEGLPNNAMTRQMAAEARVRARADVLLDVEGRYPAVDPSQVRARHNPAKYNRRVAAELIKDAPVLDVDLIDEGMQAPAFDGSNNGKSVSNDALGWFGGLPPLEKKSDSLAKAAPNAPEWDSETAPTPVSIPAEPPSCEVVIPETAHDKPDPIIAATNPADAAADVLAGALLRLVQRLPEPGIVAGLSAGTHIPHNRVPLKDLKFEEFDKEFEKLRRRKMEVVVRRNAKNDDEKPKPAWSEKTAKQARQINEIFISLVTRGGLTSYGQVQQGQLSDLLEFMEDIPPHWGRGLRKDAPTPSAERLLERGRLARKNGGDVGLDTGTIRRHFTYVSQFFRHLKAQGYYIDAQIDFAELTPAKKSKRSQNEAAEKHLASRYVRFLRLPLFSGCLDHEHMHEPGKMFYHCGLTLCPLLYYYLGARRGEMATLRPEDIVQELCGTWVIKIPDGKTENAIRTLPVPQELIRIGFLDYVEQIRSRGYLYLFPDLYSPWVLRDPGANLYTIMMQVLGKCYEEDGSPFECWSRFFHAFRHTISTTLSNRGVINDHIERIIGHAAEGTLATVYQGGLWIKTMQDALSKMPVLTSHIPSGPARLLPYVEAKDLAGWGEPRVDWDGTQRPLWQEAE